MMECGVTVKVVVCNNVWYYQGFCEESESIYRLYDASGEFLREFSSADDMTAYIIEKSSQGQKTARESMQESFMRNMEKLKKDMSDSEFAAYCGLKYETCYQYLTGRRFPTVHALAQISDACGVSIDWLVGRER